MKSTVMRPEEQRWIKLQTVAVVFVFVFYMLKPINFYLWDSLNESYLQFALPIIIAFYFYFRKLSDGLEIKLLLAYAVWFFISRIINGNIALNSERSLMVNLLLFCVVLPMGMLLDGEKRMKLLDLLSAIYCGYYTVLAVIGIYTAIFHKSLYNSITDAILSYYPNATARLEMFGYGPNTVGLWFFLSSLMLIYLFLRHKKVWCRILLLLALAANLTALGLSYCRSAMVSLSVCMGMLCALTIFYYLKHCKLWQRALILILSVCIATPLSYKAVEFSRTAVEIASGYVLTGDEAQENKAEPESVGMSLNSEADTGSEIGMSEPSNTAEIPGKRGFEDSGRLPIYKSVLYTFQQEPQRLLRGCTSEDLMTFSNQYLNEHSTTGKVYAYAEVHNTYLQILVHTGILGFLLIMAFSLLLIIQMVKLFFCCDPKATLPVKFLTLPVTGFFIYYLFESGLFYYLDERHLVFWIAAGCIIAWRKELCSAQ